MMCRKLFCLLECTVFITLAACSSEPGKQSDAGIPDSVAAEGGIDRAIEGGSDANIEGGPQESAVPDTLEADHDPAKVPTNSFCAKPEEINLVDGKVSVSGSTQEAVNEFKAEINCESAYGMTFPYALPQLYYKVALKAGKSYKFQVEPTTQADFAFYLFPADTACTSSAINKACKPLIIDKPGPRAETAIINAAEDGEIVVVVDSTLDVGDFILSIEEIVPPQNYQCATAKKVALQNGRLDFAGHNMGVPNEFTNMISCGLKDKNDDPVKFNGPQVYYQIDLLKDVEYAFEVTADFNAKYYIFKSCGTIQDDCSSHGVSGDVAEVTFDSGKILRFTPASDGTYYVAVDSLYPGTFGFFELSVVELPKAPPSFKAPFTLDFENNQCQDLVATGDWECGPLNFPSIPPLSCLSFAKAPPAADKGKGVWATLINNCYHPMGNAATIVDGTPPTCNNENPKDDSTLAFRVEIPSSCTSPKLVFTHWDDIWGPLDWAEVRVAGEVKYQRCEKSYCQCSNPQARSCPSDCPNGPGYIPPDKWKKQSIDLAGYIGKTVEVSFHFMAETIAHPFKTTGWYLDDISVACQ